MNETLCRRIVRTRSGGACEICGVEAVQMHHRRNRSQGGQWTPSNILHVCVQCHVTVTNNPNWATDRGYTIQGPQHTPELVPVQLHWGAAGEEPKWVFLLDDGLTEAA